MSLLDRFLVHFAPPGADDPDLAAAMERAALRVEPKLKETRGWPKRFRHPIAGALAQARAVAEAIPGPLEIDAVHPGSAPYLHAIFATPQNIGEILSASPVLRDYALTAGGEAFALLSMRRMEKNSLGMEMQGGILRRDVPQRLAWFADHRFSGPAASAEEARNSLLWTLFDRFLERVAVGVQRLRDERNRLSQEKDLAMARLHGAAPAKREALRQVLETVLKQLTELTEALELERLADVFETVLSHPQDCLYLQTYTLAMDDMGVLHAVDESPTSTLEFAELVERYQEPRTVILAHCSHVQLVSRAELLQRAERELS